MISGAGSWVTTPLPRSKYGSVLDPWMLMNHKLVHWTWMGIHHMGAVVTSYGSQAYIKCHAFGEWKSQSSMDDGKDWRKVEMIQG